MSPIVSKNGQEISWSQRENNNQDTSMQVHMYVAILPFAKTR